MTTTERKNEVLQIHTDHLETPRMVMNAKKQIVWRWEGDAFGDVQPQVEHVKMPLHFAGQYADEEVGLFYNYFRFYDPATGRYIENDPIDLQGGLNRYGYVGGSPLHYVDPYGLNTATIGMGCALGSWAGPIGCGAGAVVGGLIGTVATIAILSTPSDSVKDDTNTKVKEDDCEECPPCSPYPKGTIGYQGPETDKAPIPQLYERRQHYHMFKVNQNPKTCECRWNNNKDFNHQYTGPIHYKWVNLNSSPKRPPDYPH